MLPDLPLPVGIAIAAAFGAVVGSFLNVCIYRLPLGKSVVWPPSACTKCARESDRSNSSNPSSNMTSLPRRASSEARVFCTWYCSSISASRNPAIARCCASVGVQAGRLRTRSALRWKMFAPLAMLANSPEE